MSSELLVCHGIRKAVLLLPLCLHLISLGSGFHSPVSIHVEDLGPIRISTSLEKVKETVVPSTADQFDDTELLCPWDVTSNNNGSISAVKCGSGCLHSLTAVSIIILLS